MKFLPWEEDRWFSKNGSIIVFVNNAKWVDFIAFVNNALNQ